MGGFRGGLGGCDAPFSDFLNKFCNQLSFKSYFSIGPRMAVVCCGYGVMLHSLQDTLQPPLSEYSGSTPDPQYQPVFCVIGQDTKSHSTYQRVGRVGGGGGGVT